MSLIRALTWAHLRSDARAHCVAPIGAAEADPTCDWRLRSRNEVGCLATAHSCDAMLGTRWLLIEDDLHLVISHCSRSFSCRVFSLGSASSEDRDGYPSDPFTVVDRAG